MENPATWTPAHHVIWAAIVQHEKDMKRGIIGGSLPAAIVEALKQKGLLKEV